MGTPEVADSIAGAATEYLNRCRELYRYGSSPSSSVEKSILQLFIGTSRTVRLGPAIAPHVQAEILRRIQTKVSGGLPIEVTCAWGAVKTGHVLSGSVDLAEWLTLMQFKTIADAARRVYPPGARFNIYSADSYYRYLYGDTPEISEYCANLAHLAYNISPDIRVVPLSTRVQLVDGFDESCVSDYALMSDYWNASKSIPESAHSGLEAFQRLVAAGWVGPIGEETREFYMRRMRRLYLGRGERFYENKVIQFFAYALAIRQYDLMPRQGGSECSVDVCLLHIPPPSIPRGLYTNRVRLRIAPISIVKHTAPPWTVRGVIEVDAAGMLKLTLLEGNQVGQAIDCDTMLPEGAEVSIITN